ncbi:MAG TPA: hypothetical protein VF787_11690, partial [Thermoanaerobaculia bacterium]
DAYKRGVLAINAKNYRDGATAMQRAIGEMPNEAVNLRAGRELITYTPHFWLGIAKFNLGDVDGALREWKTSEDQGVITRTEYYATLKDWVGRAQTEKQRNAASAATAPKKAADTALSRALEMQLAALRAGGDRTDTYLQAQRKLQDARAQFQKAGTDVNAYKSAETTAQQAVALFTSAADEGKRLKDARPAVVPVKKAPPKVVEVTVPADTPPPATATVAPQPKPEPAAPPIESEAKVQARLAVQQYRRNAVIAPRGLGTIDVRHAEKLRNRLEQAKSDADYQQIAREATDRDLALAAKLSQLNAPVAPVPASQRPDLAPAYRAFAAGDLAGAEQILSKMIVAQPAAEVFLLRGCARYTRAMLSRNPDAQLAAANADFRAALQRDRKLRLDRTVFSPKLVAYFEQVRGAL